MIYPVNSVNPVILSKVWRILNAQSTLHNLRCWRGEPVQRRRDARLGNQRRLAPSVTTRRAPKRLPLVPLLALWLTRRKMMLDSTIFGLLIPIDSLLPVVVTTLVFVLLGLVVFALAFLVIAKASPFSVRKEIEEDQNVALAIVIAAVILGSALIIAAAVH